MKSVNSSLYHETKSPDYSVMVESDGSYTGSCKSDSGTSELSDHTTISQDPDRMKSSDCVEGDEACHDNRKSVPPRPFFIWP